MRVIELPAIENEQELEAAVRFQAQEELPMPLEQAVLDYRVLERSTTARARACACSSWRVRRDSVEHLLAAARRAGLHPELVDLSAFAMIRALYVPHGASNGADGTDGTGNGNGNGDGGRSRKGRRRVRTGDEGPNGTVYCYVGGLTNLAIATGTTCVFNRVLQTASSRWPPRSPSARA